MAKKTTVMIVHSVDETAVVKIIDRSNEEAGVCNRDFILFDIILNTCNSRFIVYQLEKNKKTIKSFSDMII